MSTISLITKQALKEYQLEHKKKLDLFIIIPAYNEEENITHVLDELHHLKLPISYQVIIINDGSQDKTSEVVKPYNAFTINLPKNQGGGYAIHLGYQFAIECEVKYVITMDADGQHQTNEMLDILKPILNKTADIVIGSRKIGKTSDQNKLRNIGISFFNRVIQVLIKHKITDCTNSYRAISIEVLKKLKPPLNYKHHTAEFIIQCVLNKFTIKEIPIHILPRRSGESKKGYSLLYAMRFANSIFYTWLKLTKEFK